MKIIILKTQSFSDIITNSSSELFVVKGDRYSSAFEYLLQQDLDWGKIAFGAHFYNSLLNQNKIKCYLYPPESLSKNLLLDSTIKVTPSSFNLNPIKEIKYEYM